MSTASKVAAHKAKHPELYCLQSGCLWRVTGLFCPRHTGKALCDNCVRTAAGMQSCCPFHYAVEAPYKAQARQIAKQYNALAQAEARPDLEE